MSLRFRNRIRLISQAGLQLWRT